MPAEYAFNLKAIGSTCKLETQKDGLSSKRTECIIESSRRVMLYLKGLVIDPEFLYVIRIDSMNTFSSTKDDNLTATITSYFDENTALN